MGELLTRAETIEKLLDLYTRQYNIDRDAAGVPYLAARCDYFEYNQQYVISRKAELWSANREEFLYLFDVPHLTEEIYRQCEAWANQDGSGRMKIGPGHMSSDITAVFVCDGCDDYALAALKKSRIHKSFHFSFHGWMDYRAVLLLPNKESVETNGAGKREVKFMKKVLYSKKRKGEN